MKRLLLILSVISFISSCGDNKKDDPKSEEEDGTSILVEYYGNQIEATKKKATFTPEQIDLIDTLKKTIIHDTSENHASKAEFSNFLKIGENYRIFFKPKDDFDHYALLQLVYTHVYAVGWVKESKINLQLQKSIQTFRNEYINCKDTDRNRCITIARRKITSDMNNALFSK